MTQRRVENDERTNERTKLEGRGKEGNAELERKRSLYEQLEKENTRNGEETEEREREGGGSAADVGTSVSVLRDVKGGIEVPLVPRG